MPGCLARTAPAGKSRAKPNEVLEESGRLDPGAVVANCALSWGTSTLIGKSRPAVGWYGADPRG